jgi:ribosomal protein L16/L10AE
VADNNQSAMRDSSHAAREGIEVKETWREIVTLFGRRRQRSVTGIQSHPLRENSNAAQRCLRTADALRAKAKPSHPLRENPTAAQRMGHPIKFQ